ncbi:hypothetical protein Tco_1232966 [Tanacetum coccineum]
MIRVPVIIKILVMTNLHIILRVSHDSLTVVRFVEGWRGFYVNKHHEMASKADAVIAFLKQNISSESVEVNHYLVAMQNMNAMQFGLEMWYGYCKNHKKTVKTGQTRTRGRIECTRAGSF